MTVWDEQVLASVWSENALTDSKSGTAGEEIGICNHGDAASLEIMYCTLLLRSDLSGEYGVYSQANPDSNHDVDLQLPAEHGGHVQGSRV
jgi:hypothetical protein